MAYNYFCRFGDDGQPTILFRADGITEEVLKPKGWAPGEFMEDIIDGSFNYGPIQEEAARELFPEGFDD